MNQFVTWSANQLSIRQKAASLLSVRGSPPGWFWLIISRLTSMQCMSFCTVTHWTSALFVLKHRMGYQMSGCISLVHHLHAVYSPRGCSQSCCWIMWAADWRLVQLLVQDQSNHRAEQMRQKERKTWWTWMSFVPQTASRFRMRCACPSHTDEFPRFWVSFFPRFCFTWRSQRRLLFLAGWKKRESDVEPATPSYTSDDQNENTAHRRRDRTESGVRRNEETKRHAGCSFHSHSPASRLRVQLSYSAQFTLLPCSAVRVLLVFGFSCFHCYTICQNTRLSSLSSIKKICPTQSRVHAEVTENNDGGGCLLCLQTQNRII